MNAYPFIIKWGKYQDALTHKTEFLIFASDEETAMNFCQNWAEEEMRLERAEIEKYGSTGNYWWKHYKIEKTTIENFNHRSVNIEYLQ